ncbi:MAG: GTP cyclohydrolase IV, partial [Asgard group archaeon]|nr:GTP cyclohydrolase IV [Asgard group archaeon]
SGIKMTDTQDLQPHTEGIQLHEVGVRNLKTILLINRDKKEFRLFPTVEIAIDLPGDLKGVHMSRLVESMTSVLSDESTKHSSVESMSTKVLFELSKKHPFSKAHMTLKFDFVVERETPASRKRTFEVYPIVVKTTRYNPSFEGEEIISHEVSVSSKGNTVCPHAMIKNEGKTHIQRAIGILTVKGRIEELPEFEAMVEVLEESFSSPTFTLLKSSDESFLVQRMFENPLFCEDVTRNILATAKERFSKHIEIKAEVESQESIHKHDVFSRGGWA